MKNSRLQSYILSHHLLESITTNIRGAKTLTLLKPNAEPLVVDIDERGNVGYDPSHKLVVVARIADAVEREGTLIVRQFLKLRVERKVESGNKRFIPQKNLYGFELGKGKVVPLTKQELRESYSLSAPVGPDLSFKEAPFCVNA